MPMLSSDGESLLGLSGWNMCTRCGEGTHDGDDVPRHAPGCPLARGGQPSRRTSWPTRRSDVYVMTPGGLMRESEVEKHRPRT